MVGITPSYYGNVATTVLYIYISFRSCIFTFYGRSAVPQESSDFGRKRSIRAAQRDRPLGSINTRNGNGSLWSMPKGHIYYIYRFFFPPSMSSSSSIFISLSLSLVSFRVLMIATDQKITTRKMAKEERTGEKKKSVNNNKSIVCGT